MKLIKIWSICCLPFAKATCSIPANSDTNANEDQGSCQAGEIWGHPEYSENMAANGWMSGGAAACMTWCESTSGCVQYSYQSLTGIGECVLFNFEGGGGTYDCYYTTNYCTA